MQQSGLSLLELIIVLAIIGVLASLMFPAVQSARERARDATCKNHLHQMTLPVAQFMEVHKTLPGRCPPGEIGGWTIEILPFLEQKNLADRVVPGTKIANAPEFLLQPPQVMRCSSRKDSAVAQNTMSSTHYVLVPVTGMKSFMMSDAPISLQAPWASGPEMNYDELKNAIGPHHGGLFYSQGFQQGVGFMLNGQDIR